MRCRIGLLCLLVLLVRAQDYSTNIVSPLQEKAVNSAVDGAAFSYPLAPIIDLPRWDFAVYAWMYVTSMTIATGKLLSITTKSGAFTAMWSDTTITFSHGGTDHTPVAMNLSRPTDKWFFVYMASSRGYSYGGVSVSDATQDYSYWPETIVIDGNSVFQAPFGAGVFEVRVM